MDKSSLDVVFDQVVDVGFDRTDIRIRFLMDPLIHALFYQLARDIEYIDELEDQNRDYDFQPSWRKRLAD
jgi:hypothetical protein